MTDAEIFSAACRQIDDAMTHAWYRWPEGRKIVTRMTLPMWYACVRHVEDREMGEKVGLMFPVAPGQRRLMGSDVELVESDEMASVSFPL